MVNFCAVFGCSNRADRERSKSYFRFPKIISHQGEATRRLSEGRRRRWVSRINREDLTDEKVDYARVCSDHFVTGKPSALFMKEDIDWAPSQLLGYQKFGLGSVECLQERNRRREERKRKQSLSTCTVTAKEDTVIEQQQGFQEAGIESNRFNDSSCQTELTVKDINMVEALKRTIEEISDHKRNLLALSLSKESFQNDDKRVSFYTGLPNFITMMAVLDLLEPHIVVTARSSLDKFQQFLVFLMRLRLNMTCEDLGYRFNVSTSTISRIFLNILDIASTRLEFLVKWPEREELGKTAPMAFRKHFKTRVAVIIDCFEVLIEKPANLLARVQTFSSCKHHNTTKFLIGICPQGGISYISKAWCGRVSDKHLTEHCGILNNLLPGDIVLADRGFDIEESTAMYHAEVKIPAFTKGKKQLGPLEIEATRNIASVCIHVEHVIGLVRRKFTILQGILPTDYLSNQDSAGMTAVDKIALVSCALTNVCDSVVPSD